MICTLPKIQQSYERNWNDNIINYTKEESVISKSEENHKFWTFGLGKKVKCHHISKVKNPECKHLLCLVTITSKVPTTLRRQITNHLTSAKW